MMESTNTTATLTAPRTAKVTTTASPVIDLVVRREPRLQVEWDTETQSYRLGISL